MNAQHRTIRLADLVRSRKGPFAFRVLLFIFGSALQLFFRRIETVNEHRVPEGTGVIFVLNHPNGLIDPALIFVALPRRISFLAKSTLFKLPVISWIVRTAGALPVYRRIDSGEDVSQNLKTFEAAHELLRTGGSIAIFPEGVSHNSTKLLPVKTGAARIALGAVSVGGGDPIDLRIVPVGLYYTNKTTFRSEALLHFGEPFTVAPVTLEPDGDPPKDAVRELTARIEESLREVTLNAENEAQIATADVAHEIFAADDTADLNSRLDFQKKYVDALTDNGRSAEAVALDERIRRFNERLDILGLEPDHLSLARFSQRFVIEQALLQTWYLILLIPIAVIGTIIHAPAYQITKLLAAIYTRHDADDIASTVKVLAGILLMPFTWLVIAVVLYFVWNWQAALASIPASFFSGWVALVSLEYFEEYRGWARAIWKFLRHKEKFLRLYVERRDLQDELQRLGGDAAK